MTLKPTVVPSESVSVKKPGSSMPKGPNSIEPSSPRKTRSIGSPRRNALRSTGDGVSTSPDYAEVARAYGIEGIKIQSAAEFKPALIRAIELDKPVVLDVPMINNPVPTSGHWNILDIYSPGEKVSHVSTE